MKTNWRIEGHHIITGFGHLVILALLVMVALALYAPLLQGRALKKDLDEARRRLGELEILYPLYAEWNALNAEPRWEHLAAPPKEKLSAAEVVSVPEQFARVAGECGIELGEVSPSVESDASGQRMLRVGVKARGPYEKLKTYLLGLARMPVLVSLERVEVVPGPSQDQFNIQALLALE